MITAIEVVNVGPYTHTEIELDPRRWTVISGPTSRGKSILLDVITLALWGTDRTGRAFPVELLRGDRSLVVLTLSSGTILKRGVALEDGARVHWREITRIGEEPKEVETDKAWIGEIKALGVDVDALRTVLVPMAWTALARGEGGGRPLRDLLVRVTASGAPQIREVVAQLVEERGGELRKHDPIGEDGAKAAAKSARKRLENAEGALGMSRRSLEALLAESTTGPTASNVDEARELLEVAAAWRAHDEAAAAVERRNAEIVASGARAVWRRRRAELPAEPEPIPPGSLDDVDAAIAIAETQIDALDAEIQRCRTEADGIQATPSHVEELARRVRDVEVRIARAAEGGECETCGQPWPHGPADVEILESTLADRRAELDRARRDVEARDAIGWRARDHVRLRDVERGRLRELRERRADLERRARLRSAWSAAIDALGPEPRDEAAATVPAPRPPDVPRPGHGDVAHARGVVEDAAQAAGARAKVAEGQGRLEALVAEAAATVERAAAELARVEILVAAVRMAPSVALRRQLAALGDIRPASIELGAKGGAQIHVHGRPWSVPGAVADGFRLAADLAFRAGIRRAMGAAWLPIVVDRAQDLRGHEWPDVRGPVIALETSPTDAIRVAATARDAFPDSPEPRR